MHKNYNTIKKQLKYLFEDSYLEDKNIISKLKSLDSILNSFLVNSILIFNINKESLIRSMQREIDLKIVAYEQEKQELLNNQSLYRNYSIYCGSKSLDQIDEKINMMKNLRDSLSSELNTIIKSKSNDFCIKEKELKDICFKELLNGKKFTSKNFENLYTDLQINKEVLENIESIIEDKDISDELRNLFIIYNREKKLQEEIEQITLFMNNHELLSKRLKLILENQNIDIKIMRITTDKVDPFREKIKALSNNRLFKIFNSSKIMRLKEDLKTYCRYTEKIYSKKMNNLSCIEKIENSLKNKGLKLNFYSDDLFNFYRYNCILEDKNNQLCRERKKYEEQYSLLGIKTKKMLENDFEFIKDITNNILLDQNNYFNFYILYVLENMEEIIKQAMRENDNYNFSTLITEVKKEFIKTYTQRKNEIDDYVIEFKTKKLTSEN